MMKRTRSAKKEGKILILPKKGGIIVQSYPPSLSTMGKFFSSVLPKDYIYASPNAQWLSLV